MIVGGASNANRITGLASGLDVDSVVKGMMMREQAKIDKIYQDKSLLELRQEDYRETIKGMKEFQKYFDPTSDKFLSKSKLMTTKATAADEKSFKVNANGDAKNGAYKVEVKSLAEGAKIEGKTLGGVVKVGDIFTYKSKDPTTPLDVKATIGTDDKIVFKMPNDSDVSESLKSELETALKGKVYKQAKDPNDSNSTEETFIKFESTENVKIDGASVGVISESNTLESLGCIPNVDNYELNVKVNNVDKKIIVKATKDDGTKATIKDLADALNKETDGQVKLNLDKTLNKVCLESTKTGVSQSMEVTGGGLADKLGLINKKDQGIDAKVIITAPDGLSTTATSSTNSINEMGLEINVKAVNTTGSPTEVTVDKSGGVEESMKTIKSFVDDYNAIVANLNKKLSERSNFKYKPLTDAQKKDMSDTDIKNWNDKVKQGMFRNDPLLSALQKDLKNIFGDNVEGANAKLGKYGEASFGMDFSSDMSNPGRIEIDESKLKAALESKPDIVSEFFTKSSSKTVDKDKSYKSSDKYKEDGIINRMNQIMKDYVGIPGIGEDGKGSLSGSMNIQVNKQYDFSYTGFAGKNTMPDQIYRQQLTMDKLQKKFYEKQEQLYKNFSTLETSMNKLNSQMSYLGAQTG